MKLWYSTTSPFVRKVRAVAHYHQLQNQIELLLTTKAFSSDSPHNQDNPLGRIPALQLDNGNWLYNSSTIAEYFDAIGTEKSLFPQDEQRWKVLSLYGLAEGVLENTVTALLPDKMFRPENEWWISRHQQIIKRNDHTLKLIAEQIKPYGTELNIATLHVVCVVDFLLFREKLTETAHYSALSELKQWAEKMNSLYPCLAETKPFVA